MIERIYFHSWIQISLFLRLKRHIFIHCVFFISEHLSWPKMCIFGGSFLTQVSKCHCGSWHTLVQKTSFKIMLPHVDISQWVRKALEKKEGPYLDSKWSLNCLLNNPVLVLSQKPGIRSFFLQTTNKKGTFNKNTSRYLLCQSFAIHSSQASSVLL